MLWKAVNIHLAHNMPDVMSKRPIELAMPSSFRLENRPSMLQSRRDPELHLALLATAARAPTPL
jgi:hypothetical protein